ncbi:ABC transporter permease [Planctomycetota bacterium]
MYLHHLLLLSLADLLTRRGRTIFLVLGVAVGTGALAFLLALRGGLDQSVRGRLQHLRATMERREDLLRRKEETLNALPVNRLTVRPRTGGRNRLVQDDVERMRSLRGVRRVETVAFLFPMTLGLKAEGLAVEVYGRRFPLFEREVTTFVTIYGVPDSYLAGSVPLEGGQIDVGGDKSDSVPTVLPAGWLDYLATVGDPSVRKRFAELFTRRVLERMQHPRARAFVDRLKKKFGESFVTEAVMKAAVERAMGDLLDKLEPRTLLKQVSLVLYPGLESSGAHAALEVIGSSTRVPGGGLSVPLKQVEQWSAAYAAEAAGLLDQVLGRDRELLLSEAVVTSESFEDTVALHETLADVGFRVESAVDQIRPLLSDLASVEAEEARLRAEAARVEDLGRAVVRGTVLLSPLLFLLGGAVVANGLALSVLEQQRRIGILRAVGACRLDVLLVFLQEALCIGAAGALLGLGLAEVTLRVAGPGLLAGLVAGTSQPPELHLTAPMTLGVAALAVGVSLVAGFLPALRASLVSPVDVLR